MKEPQRLTTEAFWENWWHETASSPAPLAGYFKRVWLGIFDRVFAAARQGESCLEAGCGNSRFLPLLAQRYGLAVAGLDYTESGCRSAREQLRRAGVDAPIHQCDLFAPNEDLLSRFDYVMSFGLIEHFDEPAAAIGAMKRFLKPSGHILTTVPNLSPHSLNVLTFRTVGPRILAMHKLMTLEQLRDYHERNGFVTVECRFAGVGISTMADRRSVARKLLQQAVFRLAQAARKLCECLHCEPPANAFTGLYMVYHGKL